MTADASAAASQDEENASTSRPGREELQSDPEGRYRVLAITCVAVVLGLGTWFSATAVR